MSVMCIDCTQSKATEGDLCSICANVDEPETAEEAYLRIARIMVACGYSDDVLRLINELVGLARVEMRERCASCLEPYAREWDAETVRRAVSRIRGLR